MLDQNTRATILRLHEAEVGTRAIARALKISRGAVKSVIADGGAAPPMLERLEKAEPYREQILDLYGRCKGNVVRVHEELLLAGAQISYAALTAFCRRHDIGGPPPPPAGEYHFEPGEEMQHDTSPHDVSLGGRLRRAQTASLVLCYSRLLYFQHYPRFDRFTCKVFLTDAARYVDGVARRCMIDNTHVVVASGTGRDMVPAPEMAAFAERLGFTWAAHEKGDANRSARVERPFHYIENNFLAGREFADWAELNREAEAWCDKVNAKHRRHLHAAPRELFAAEKPRLRPLPAWLPDVYALHQRIVDVEGYVNVHRNRYSAPYRLIGRRVEVRETKDRIEIFVGPRLVASHARLIDSADVRVCDPTHRPPRGEGRHARGDNSVEHDELLRLAPELGDYLALLKAHAAGRGLRDVRRLLRMVSDYPRAPLVETVRLAGHYGLFDLERVERMLLRSLARGFFFTPPPPPDVPDPEDSDDR
jgi:Mu transposase, C-terminal domain